MGAGDDFFFTGGGFSDWSGGSAGKFSSGSSTGGSSSGGVHSGDERKQGVSDKYIDTPAIVGKTGLIWRILMICFLLFMQGVGAIMYLHYPEWEGYFGHGTVFICSWLYLIWFIIAYGNILYKFRSISIWKMHLFRMSWHLFCCASLLICAVFALTPVVCHYCRYWLVQHHELFIFTFFDEFTYLYSSHYDLEYYWWVMIISALLALVPFASALAMLYSIPKEVKITRNMIHLVCDRQHSLEGDRNLTNNPISTDTKWLFNSILMIGMLFAGVMIIGACKRYNSEKDYYDMRMESQQRMDEMLHRYDQPDKDASVLDTVPYTDVTKPATPATPPPPASKRNVTSSSSSYRTPSGYYSGYSSSSRSSTYDDDWDDEDDDDTWYRDEDDADEQYEYDYWE